VTVRVKVGEGVAVENQLSTLESPTVIVQTELSGCGPVYLKNAIYL